MRSETHFAATGRNMVTAWKKHLEANAEALSGDPLYMSLLRSLGITGFLFSHVVKTVVHHTPAIANTVLEMLQNHQKCPKK